MGAKVHNFEIDGGHAPLQNLIKGNAPHRWGGGKKNVRGAFVAAKMALYILKLAFYCILKHQFLIDVRKSTEKVHYNVSQL